MEVNPVTPQQNKPRGLAFLEVGLFEFFFVAIVLILLFGTLNYFNILQISEVFPNQLGWLPHQANKQITKVINKQNPVSSPTNLASATFQYDTSKAKSVVTQYIKDTIKSEHLPAVIEVKQGLTIDGRIEDVKNEFGSSITASGATISANFHLKENTNTPNDYTIFIQSNTTQTTATTSLANSLLSSYFTSPYIISDCQTKGVTSYCENLQTSAEGKKGYGVAFINSGSKITNIVFSCFIPKESKDYDATKSCIAPF